MKKRPESLGKMKRRASPPALRRGNLCVRKCTTSVKASTALDRLSRPLRSVCRRPVGQESNFLRPDVAKARERTGRLKATWRGAATGAGEHRRGARAPYQALLSVKLIRRLLTQACLVRRGAWHAAAAPLLATGRQSEPYAPKVTPDCGEPRVKRHAHEQSAHSKLATGRPTSRSVSVHHGQNR